MPLDIKLHPESTRVENSLAYHIPLSSCKYVFAIGFPLYEPQNGVFGGFLG